MTHDICILKTRTNKHKQTDVILYVNDGCGLNNCYYKVLPTRKVLCFKGKDMYFRWRRQNRDRTGLDHRQKVLKKKKSKKSNRLYELVRNNK